MLDHKQQLKDSGKDKFEFNIYEYSLKKNNKLIKYLKNYIY